jgi:hypothetical protein
VPAFIQQSWFICLILVDNGFLFRRLLPLIWYCECRLLHVGILIDFSELLSLSYILYYWHADIYVWELAALCDSPHFYLPSPGFICMQHCCYQLWGREGRAPYILLVVAPWRDGLHTWEELHLSLITFCKQSLSLPWPTAVFTASSEELSHLPN